MAIQAVSVHVFLTGLGLYVGTRVRTTTAAMVVVLMVIVTVWGLAPATLDELRNVPELHQPAEAAWRVNPLVQVYTFIAEIETSPYARDGFGNEAPSPRAHMGMQDLLRSVALHIGAGLVLAGLAARRFRQLT